MRFTIKNIIFLFVAIFALSSCVTNKDTRYLQNIKTTYAKSSFEEYKLRPDDEVSIRVFSLNPQITSIFIGDAQSQMSQSVYSYRIYADSTIDLPYIHKLKIGGCTIRDAEALITQKLKEYVKDDASVKVAMMNKSFYVIGEAGRGQFPVYKDKLNIFEALAMSGDLTLSANRKNIRILRQTPEGEKVVQFDLRAKSIVDSECYYVEPNDIIFVSRSASSFYKINSFTTFLGMITSTISFVILVTQYSN
jgi:polysaccharide export outer membrane protein